MRVRRWPVRTILIAIAIVLVIPGLLFGAVLLSRFAQADRAESKAELLGITGRVADALDRELASLIATSRVLATSPALYPERTPEFADAARAVMHILGQSVVLAATDGAVLIDTGGAIGQALDAPEAIEAVRRATATRKPVVSDLFRNRAGLSRIAVLTPVLGDNGTVLAVVGVVVDPSSFEAILRDQALPPGWMIGLRDGSGKLLARNAVAIGLVGSTLGRSAEDADMTTRIVAKRDGSPLLAAATKSRLSPWRVGVGVPLSVLEQPLRTSVLVLALSGSVTLLLGGGLAWHLARVISVPLSQLAAAGRDLGAGREVRPVRSRIGEVATLSRALLRASADLGARSAALASERAQLAAIIETVPVGLLIAEGPSGRIVAGNRQLQRMLPEAAERDAEAIECFDEAGAPVPGCDTPLVRALSGEDPAELRCRLRRADNSLGWIQSVAAPIRHDDGRVTGAVLALLDVDEVVRAREQKARWAERLEEEVASRTAALEHANQRLRDEMSARNRAEDQLRQAQKMEAVGQLTGGIAHDFNNLLTVILGSLDLLRRRIREPNLFRLVDNAMEGANRAASLTASLLAFSRRQPLIPQPVDVNKLVESMSTLLRRTLGETIQVETVLAADVWPAITDPNQLENALLNLAVNARDAILDASPSGGTLRLASFNQSVDSRYAAQVPDARPGDYVVIATADSGAGMSTETLARVFEPFFTTKRSGRGTGLGLSQVHGFAAQSGGHVTIETELGHGTTVRLFLPRLREDMPSARPPDPSRAHLPGGKGKTILIVEDDPAVRQFTGEALREQGYRVLEAEGGEPALTLLAAHPETALLMTDVVMPGMSGRELAARVHGECPDLPILLTSGYSRLADGSNPDLPWGMLGKPFTLAALANKIADLLR